jgi:predicted extracellular nuclease
MGDTVSGLSGVLYYKWAGASASDATWRVTSIQDGSVNFVKSNHRPLVPPNFGSSHKLASGNVLNFFRTIGNGSATAIGLQPRGANNQEEFLRQKTKLVTALLELDPDILGMLELENEFLPSSSTNALEYLVQEMNLLAGAGTFGWVDPGTEFVDSSDAISSGFLYKTSSIEGIVGSVSILRDDNLSGIGVDDAEPIFTGPNTNRASIAASFKVRGGECITVALNHLKSKGGTGTGDNADKVDGAGNWNAIRLKVRSNFPPY